MTNDQIKSLIESQNNLNELIEEFNYFLNQIKRKVDFVLTKIDLNNQLKIFKVNDFIRMTNKKLKNIIEKITYSKYDNPNDFSRIINDLWGANKENKGE